MENIIKEVLPGALEREFSKISNGEEIHISVLTDLGGDGRFGEQWLIATDSEIIIFSPNGINPSLVKKLLMNELASVKTQSLIDGGSLEASRIDGELVEIMRFSNAHANKFAAVAKWLDQKVKGETPSVVAEEPPAKCPKCGLRLEEGSKVCPRCVQRRKVLLRLVYYLKPHLMVTCIIIALIFSSTGIRLIPPYFTKIIIDDAITSKNYILLGWIVLGMAAISFVGVGLSILRGRTTAWLGSKISYDVRGQLYDMIQRMSLRFFDKHKTGELISRGQQGYRFSPGVSCF